MATSFGGALMAGDPIVMRGEPYCFEIPEVFCRENKKAEALDLLDKMGIIRIVIVPDKPSKISKKKIK